MNYVGSFCDFYVKNYRKWNTETQKAYVYEH